MSRDNKSAYYDAGGIEVLDIIKAKLTPEQYTGYLLGNALKYQCRLMHKHAGQGRIRDAVKAKNYSSWLLTELEEQETQRAEDEQMDVLSKGREEAK